jgi:diacylglycerol kinase (ATP)
VWTGAKNLRRNAVKARVRVDGTRVHDGEVSCVLAGNVGSLFGGITVFPDAAPDDGSLELAIVTASSLVDWSRVILRTMQSRAARSPFVSIMPARTVRVRFEKPVPYELDGGARPAAEKLKIGVEPQAVTIRVPQKEASK